MVIAWRVDVDLHCADSRVKSRATVESEPAEPDQNGSKEDESRVVRLAVRRVTSSLALAQNKRICQACPTGCDVNGSTTSIVKRRQVKEPSVGVPGPGCDRAVDDRGPAEGKDQTG